MGLVAVHCNRICRYLFGKCHMYTNRDSETPSYATATSGAWEEDNVLVIMTELCEDAAQFSNMHCPW